MNLFLWEFFHFQVSGHELSRRKKKISCDLCHPQLGATKTSADPCDSAQILKMFNGEAKELRSLFAQGLFCAWKMLNTRLAVFQTNWKNIRKSNFIIFLDSFGMKTPPKKVEFNHQPPVRRQDLGVKHSNDSLHLCVWKTPNKGR